MLLIYALAGFLVGALLIYIIEKPKMKNFVQQDQETASANKKLQDEFAHLQLELTLLRNQKEEVLNSIKALEQQAKDAGQKMLEQNYELAETSFEHQAELMATKFQEYQKSVEDEYLQTMQEMSADVSAKLNEYYKELNTLECMIADKQSIVSAAVEANKRAVEMENQKDFYRLVLSDEDKEEIEQLKKIVAHLRNSEPLNKVIWKVYYEKPYTDMIGRVVGQGVHTGIYKITNIKNNMCYVGQAANIADRWKQHIKRGMGAEAPTRNKLYPAMASFGVENFTFEIVEECERSLLNDREDYWQEYFHAKDFGYSIK